MWIHNRINLEFKPLEDIAVEIENILREYLGTDKLI